MTESLILIGVACVIAAIVGGGLQLVNIKLPVLDSLPRQIILATVGIVVIAGGLVLRETGPPTDTGEAKDPSAQFSSRGDFGGPGQATITLSVGEGPPGTKLTVSGQGFSSGETVRIRFHTTELARVTANGSGSFTDVPITIPSDWPFDGQVRIIASGESSLRSTHEPFEVT